MRLRRDEIARGSLSFRVCIQGFTPFECSTFESFFRLAARRAPSYQVVTDIAQADIVIADADRPASLDAVARAGKLPRTLTIGATAVPGSAAGASRPINMMALLRMLDELTSNNSLWSQRGDKEAAPTQAASIGAPRAGGGPSPTALVTAPIREADGPMPGADTSRDADRILLVDDSDVALRFMQMRLHRLRFQVSLASSGDQALRMLDTERYAFVFLDVMMAGMDGFETCKRIKRKHYADQVKPPHVVMLTSKGSPIDKLRGAIARCDAYLVKPLNELELIKVITELAPGFMSPVDGFVAA
jgi:CheY-like chemotaxis protein